MKILSKKFILIILSFIGLSLFFMIDFALGDTKQTTQVPVDKTSLNEIIKQINWLISLIVGILLSIFANLITPLFQNFIATFSYDLTQKRIAAIRKEIAMTEQYFRDKQKLIIDTLEILLKILVQYMIIRVLEGFAIHYNYLSTPILDLIIAFLYIRLIILIMNNLNIYRKVKNFNKYKSEQEKTIQKLQTNKPLI